MSEEFKEGGTASATSLTEETVTGGWASQDLSFITALELLKRRKAVDVFTTGCKALDDLLGGGVETQSITEICGEYGAGKTQLCHQLCITVQLPPSKGGLLASSIYIDTEGTFRPERLVEMAHRFGLPSKQALENVLYARAHSSEQQMLLIEEASKLLNKFKIKLIIIDNLVSHFRSELCGKAGLIERQQKLNRHIHQLLKIASTFNVAVVVTNQVLSDPDTNVSQRPAGGHVVAHGCTHRIWLRKLIGNRRAARIFDSPSRPEAEALFMITSDGIKDL
ncbi:MAG: DNA repair and recombination protein RadA [Candidatus Nezhaarchaeales archaeon]